MNECIELESVRFMLEKLEFSVFICLQHLLKMVLGGNSGYRTVVPFRPAFLGQQTTVKNTIFLDLKINSKLIPACSYFTKSVSVSFQQHMPYFRRRMIYEMLNKELM